MQHRRRYVLQRPPTYSPSWRCRRHRRPTLPAPRCSRPPGSDGRRPRCSPPRCCAPADAGCGPLLLSRRLSVAAVGGGAHPRSQPRCSAAVDAGCASLLLTRRKMVEVVGGGAPHCSPPLCCATADAVCASPLLPRRQLLQASVHRVHKRLPWMPDLFYCLPVVVLLLLGTMPVASRALLLPFRDGPRALPVARQLHRWLDLLCH